MNCLLRGLIAQLSPGFALLRRDTRTVETDIYHANRIVPASVLKYTVQGTPKGRLSLRLFSPKVIFA